MDASTRKCFSRQRIAQFPRTKNIPHLLDCIAIDSYFLSAIAFKLLRTRWLLVARFWTKRLDKKRRQAAKTIH